MMLRYSLGQEEAAKAVEAAVDAALSGGARTKDIALEGEEVLSTAEMGDRVLAALEVLT
jgi:3-isopropylmalate dehydrogenase